jgi:hypothetical protein
VGEKTPFTILKSADSGHWDMKSYGGSSHKSQVGYIPGETCVDDDVALCYPMYYDNP